MALFGGDKKTTNNQYTTEFSDQSVNTSNTDNSVTNITNSDLGSIKSAFDFASKASEWGFDFGAKALDSNNDSLRIGAGLAGDAMDLAGNSSASALNAVVGLASNVATGGQSEMNNLVTKIGLGVAVVVVVGFAAMAWKGKK